MWANAYYSSEVQNLAIPSLTGTLVAKASAIAKVPSFMWMDTQDKVPQMDSALADIRAANKAGANPPNAGIFVVYDLPDRDCAAAASNGEFSIANGGVAKYKAYIDSIRANVIKYSDIRIILVIGKWLLPPLLLPHAAPKFSTPTTPPRIPAPVSTPTLPAASLQLLFPFLFLFPLLIPPFPLFTCLSFAIVLSSSAVLCHLCTD
jgi:cellulase/cellobiase CelA1